MLHKAMQDRSDGRRLEAQRSEGGQPCKGYMCLAMLKEEKRCHCSLVDHLAVAEKEQYHLLILRLCDAGVLSRLGSLRVQLAKVAEFLDCSAF